MLNPAFVSSLLFTTVILSAVTPALAVDGQVVITHAKALAGNVTPGDAAGYPVTISKPGSYKLASNLIVPERKTGIQVTSDNVTIDLNGFTLHGVTVASYGITGGSMKSLTIENGTITRFNLDGIYGTGDYWIVDNMRSIENGRDGVGVGQFALIKSSIFVKNNRYGIRTSYSSVIQGNTASNNKSSGISTYTSTVVGNAINANGSWGLGGTSFTGYSGNTLVGNDAGTEALGVVPHQPNACFGTCP